jgi:hypothetical protein
MPTGTYERQAIEDQASSGHKYANAIVYEHEYKDTTCKKWKEHLHEHDTRGWVPDFLALPGCTPRSDKQNTCQCHCEYSNAEEYEIGGKRVEMVGACVKCDAHIFVAWPLQPLMSYICPYQSNYASPNATPPTERNDTSRTLHSLPHIVQGFAGIVLVVKIHAWMFCSNIRVNSDKNMVLVCNATL